MVLWEETRAGAGRDWEGEMVGENSSPKGLEAGGRTLIGDDLLNLTPDNLWILKSLLHIFHEHLHK